ncbi:MAG: hypothetical protein GTO45_30645 [Candidatus Aminicenantes bacterium]|nr:hypothetical protein [Candidatus Aminicenantes bacterium]NIM83151.1 hypothetical protein [Candidatus Aminicenantes bacterium]NIN22527.1 hypothetical protein [Candidatus Aminicenantes bacterium]NIN46298.1 hypothetical protein [Candidatus Aminicenantes bacterium]NIN89137.1 hypothetical protein [Candidatus Aminicenantes bacterium]
MTEEERRKRVIESLKENLVSLKEAVENLQYTCEECRKISLDNISDNRDLNTFEELTSRFGRLWDILVDQIFKKIEILEGKKRLKRFTEKLFGGNLKLMDHIEQLGIIESADSFFEVEELRNAIDNQYQFSIEEKTALFQYVLDDSEHFFKTADKVKDFVTSRYLGW